MHGGEFVCAYRHLARICEVYEVVGAPMAKHIETKRDEGSGTSKCGIAERHQEGDGDSSGRNEHSFHN